MIRNTLLPGLGALAFLAFACPMDSTLACPACCQKDCHIDDKQLICKDLDSECVRIWQKYISGSVLDGLEQVERPVISLHWLVRSYTPRKVKHSSDYWHDLTPQSYIFPDIIQVNGIVAALSSKSGSLLIHSPGLKRGINIFSPERLLGCNDFASQELQSLKTGDYVILRGQLHKNSSKGSFVSLQHCIIISASGNRPGKTGQDLKMGAAVVDCSSFFGHLSGNLLHFKLLRG